MSETGLRQNAAKEIARALTDGNSYEDVKTIYAHWAGTYDQHMRECKFKGPFIAAKTVQDHYTNKNIKILDVGCGTGMVGEYLKEFGFHNADGLDPSEKMLGIARAKNVYKNYIAQGIEGENSTDIPSDSYDVVVVSGGFAPGHLLPEAVDEMIRFVKPGGFIFNVGRLSSLNLSDYKDKWEPHLAKLEADKKWEEVSRTIYKKYVDNDDGILYIHKIL